MAETAPTYVTDRRIGKAVAGEVAYAGLHHQVVAEAIGMDKASFSRSVAGKRQWKATEILDIAQFLDIPVSYLLEPRRPPSASGHGEREADTIGYPMVTPIHLVRHEFAEAA